jgi:hypothetical protein
MIKAVSACLVLAFASANFALGGDAPKSEEDLKREAAIAEFTRKMKEANYPALFEQAAKEFNVPADILKGVAFAETRWEHLTWPPGETASPETGMPRPYGIMSLMDNKYFGHSLTEAAQLLGQDPEVLKSDPLQNMRGGAALLRKIYDETPKPSGTSEADIESWRYAIRKYCGIPEPELAASHALDVYVFMSRGYHQYGIEWNARAVNLEPMREETRRMVAEERAKREAAEAASSGRTNSSPVPQLSVSTQTPAQLQSNRLAEPPATAAPVPAAPAAATRRNIWWFILGALAALAALWWFSRQQSKTSN